LADAKKRMKQTGAWINHMLKLFYPDIKASGEYVTLPSLLLNIIIQISSIPLTNKD
jgi:hypothetical protein